jgi:hypothetical protein
MSDQQRAGEVPETSELRYQKSVTLPLYFWNDVDLVCVAAIKCHFQARSVTDSAL